MKINSVVVAIGTPHRMREPGKESPEGKLKECIYGREMASRIASALQKSGYKCFIDYTPLDLPEQMQCDNTKVERARELEMRVNFVNELCKKYGAKNVIYVSLHVDASGNDNNWHSPNGWSVRVGTKASEQSKRLAGCLYDIAKSCGLKVRQPDASTKFWTQDLYVLNRTCCPAVLTENLFQDNRDDVAFLLSDYGKLAIESIHVTGIIKYIESL